MVLFCTRRSGAIEDNRAVRELLCKIKLRQGRSKSQRNKASLGRLVFALTKNFIVSTRHRLYIVQTQQAHLDGYNYSSYSRDNCAAVTRSSDYSRNKKF
jgi:hypothetical protein